MPLEGLVSLLNSHSVFRRQVQGTGVGDHTPKVSRPPRGRPGLCRGFVDTAPIPDTGDNPPG